MGQFSVRFNIVLRSAFPALRLATLRTNQLALETVKIGRMSLQILPATVLSLNARLRLRRFGFSGCWRHFLMILVF